MRRSAHARRRFAPLARKRRSTLQLHLHAEEVEDVGGCLLRWLLEHLDPRGARFLELRAADGAKVCAAAAAARGGVAGAAARASEEHLKRVDDADSAARRRARCSGDGTPPSGAAIVAGAGARPHRRRTVDRGARTPVLCEVDDFTLSLRFGKALRHALCPGSRAFELNVVAVVGSTAIQCARSVVIVTPLKRSARERQPLQIGLLALTRIVFSTRATVDH
mgnify:CR=1 FL=1